MNFTRIQSETEKPFAIDFCLIEADGAHPKALDRLSAEEVFEVLEISHISDAMSRIGRPDPGHPLLGSGDVFYNAYDTEFSHSLDGSLGVLSYQFYCAGIGGDLAVICYPNSTAIEDRLGIAEMLSEVIRIALMTGCLIAPPKHHVLIGFSLRSDLAVTSDLPFYKRQLSNVGGKVVTAGGPVDFEIVHQVKDLRRLMTPPSLSLRQGKTAYLISTRFVDIALHAAPRVSLAKIGKSLGLEKLDLERDLPGYTKARMDLVKEDHFDYFRLYGVTDCEICLRYWIRILAFAQEVVGVDDVPVSAGALAVQLCLKTMREGGFDYETVFDIYEKEVLDWQVTQKGPRRQKQMVIGGDRAFHEHFAIMGFHGGRNECYWVGPVEPDMWIDFDMIGAYTTGLVVFRRICFRLSFETCFLKDFLGDVVGVAWVEFYYPKPVRYPCLPVRSEKRGLIYPLSGRTYATAPELELAHAQGAKIRILRGVVWPWEETPEDERIFEPFVRKIRELRKAYQHDAVFEEYAKLLGNSVYGKTAQSLRDSNAFDISLLDSKKIGPSALTNGVIAAHVTGFVRAVLGEIIHRIPEHRTVLSATTDGFLTNAREDEIDLSGPLCQRFLGLCERVES